LAIVRRACAVGQTPGRAAPRARIGTDLRGSCGTVGSASVDHAPYEVTTIMRKTSSFLHLTSVLALSLVAGAGSSFVGCGGSGGGTGGGGGGSGTPGCFDYSSFDGMTPEVHFAADVLPILRGSCGLSTSCHGNENGSGGQHYYGPKNSDPTPTADQIMAI